MHLPGYDTAIYPSTRVCLGRWLPAENPFSDVTMGVTETLRHLRRPVCIVERGGELLPVCGGVLHLGTAGTEGFPLLGYAPPCLPEQLGDAGFCREFGIRYPYIGGSMAKGISSAAMVEEMGRGGMICFFGAAGLPLSQVDAACDRLSSSMGDTPYGFNLIHSPHEPELERELASLYIRKGVRIVEASAFLALTLPLVRYRLHGIHRREDGEIVTPNAVFAKVSREELAEKFMSPPPDELVRELVATGHISGQQAELAARIPMAQVVTAEADSAGHTDNRPAVALFPTIASIAGRMSVKYGYGARLYTGLGGGISTPAAAAAAFAMGASYVMTGTVNQACVESGTSDEVREMLKETRQADVAMAPAADMFEMGVTVQVLKRGTMFPMRAAKLFELYRNHGSLDSIPAPEKEKLEKNLFRASIEEVWHQTRSYFLERDPAQAERGERDPKHRMALVFRWYLGQAAHWARDGESSRRMDYQVWCGPAMGAFNEWVSGSCLEPTAARKVVPVAMNILFGAAVLTRANALRQQGVDLGATCSCSEPLEQKRINEYLR